MRDKYERELNELNRNLTEMARLCNESVYNAIKALETKNRELAEKVIEGESTIDQFESANSQMCLYLVLRNQPVAADMRFVVEAIRINDNLERIGDQAEDISRLVIQMLDAGYEERELGSIVQMAKICSDMLNASLNAFVNGDSELAESAGNRDDEVDALFIKVRDEIVKEIREGEADAATLVDLVMVAKYLERIGDHAQNISEAVIYAITSEHVKLQ